MIEPEERRDRSYPFLDIAADHDPAVGSDVARENQVRVVEVISKQAPPHHRSYRNATRAVIARVDIVFPLRIVELGSAPLDDDVAVALFAEVDARLVDFGTAIRNGRNIPQIEEWQPFGALASDRAHHRAV